MSSEFIIGGHDESSVKIELLDARPSGPVLDDAKDDSWLECDISVRTRGFQGAVRASLTTGELRSFFEDIRRIASELAGELVFEALENNLSLTIEMRPTGTALVKGMLRSAGAGEAALSFSFDSDQTLLTGAANEIETMLDRVPSRSSAS